MGKKVKQLGALPAPAKAQGNAPVPLQSGAYYKALNAGQYIIAGFTFTVPQVSGQVGIMAKVNTGWPQLGLCQGNLAGYTAHAGTVRPNVGHHILYSACKTAVAFMVNCNVNGCGWAIIVFGPNYFTVAGK